jgi:transcriptional regulator with XRE-family HTH domain
MRSTRSRPPVEPLSARILRLRIARGYSIDDLAFAAEVLPSAIRRLESGKPVDKHVLSRLAAALGVPLCLLVCGEHSCADRACVPPTELQHGGTLSLLVARSCRTGVLCHRPWRQPGF